MSAPYTIDDGRRQLILNPLPNGQSALYVGALGSGQTILLTPAEKLALAHALCGQSRKPK